MTEHYLCFQVDGQCLQLDSAHAAGVREAINRRMPFVEGHDLSGASFFLVPKHVVLLLQTTPETRARQRKIDATIQAEEPFTP